MDRVSELPYSIIEYILSFLPAEEAAQTALVSKTWLHAWSSIPTLDFSHKRIFEKHFKNDYSYSQRKDEQLGDKFVKFVDNTLRRHNLGIHKFKLTLFLADTELASIVDQWLQIVVAKDVKLLHLFLDMPMPGRYTLPLTILTASSIISLKVRGNFPLRFELCDQLVQKCYTLKKLQLHKIRVDEPTLLSLSSIFPCIEELGLYYCFLKYIKLSNVPYLKRIHVEADYPPTVDITEAHGLELFIYYGSVCEYDKNQYFNILPSQSLKSLSFNNSVIRSTYLHSLLSQCPFLEDLSLDNCNNLEWINISSTSLKSLTLYGGWRLTEIKIDAMNLSKLYYENGLYPSFSLTTRPDYLESSLGTGFVEADLDTSFFTKLSGLLAQIRPSLMLLVIICNKISLDVEELRKVVVPDPKPKVEILQMELRIYNGISTCSELLDGLFWTFCLESLVANTKEDNQESLKTLCKELMDRRRSPDCCVTNEFKCWRHHLNHVDVEYKEKNKDEGIIRWHHLDWKSWVDGSNTFYDNRELRIRFTLKW